MNLPERPLIRISRHIMDALASFFTKKAPLFMIITAAFLSILAVSYYRLFDNYELGALDLRFLLRPKIPVTDKVALIEIGDDSIEKLGRFPFDRSYHALLVKALKEAGASTIVFDIFFSEPHEHDAQLKEVMRDSGIVYIPYGFDLDSKAISNVPAASGYVAKNLEDFTFACKGTGHINIPPDIDGKFRRFPVFVNYNDALFGHLSFLAGCDYLGIGVKDVHLVPGRCISCGPDIKIPLDERSNMIINYAGRWDETYKHYSYIDVLRSYLAGASGEGGALDLSVFKDKICIVGLTAAGTADLHPTPFETLCPGMGIHAEIFNSLLNRKFIARASRGSNILILMALTLLTSLLTIKIKPLRMLFVLAGIIFAFGLIGVALFDLFGFWIDLLYPALIVVLLYVSVTLYKYAAEWKKRLFLENELIIARTIQESFLPKELPHYSGIGIAAVMFTARQVGGDLYDFIEFGPDRLGVMIGDVSGKGVPASLFMAMVTGKFEFFATPGSKPEDALLNLNTALTQKFSTNLFVTVYYAIFDFRDRTVSYASGGHLPTAYTGPGKGLKFLDVDVGLPLGLMEGPYTGNTVKFDKDDLFVFYTDGITEAMNEKSEMYGKERLAALIESKKGLSPDDLLSAIEKDVRSFEPKAKQHDDITLIIIKIK
ncbi:MAG: CHASE2 domain-containing protein [Candidatus Omnitrophica bacterium]|nr:CHASE2 domain-containing protein [Candidatus Omnitrophota bacterium]